MAICLIFLGFLFGTNCTETKPMVYSVNETISNQLTSNVSNELHNSPNGCKIVFYDETNYQGKRVHAIEPEGISHLDLHEKSAQTDGSCCWKIYR